MESFGWRILIRSACLFRYPDHLAWQLNVKKTIIRKSPEFRKFQNFLVYETQSVCFSTISYCVYESELTSFFLGYARRVIYQGRRLLA